MWDSDQTQTRRGLLPTKTLAETSRLLRLTSGDSGNTTFGFPCFNCGCSRAVHAFMIAMRGKAGGGFLGRWFQSEVDQAVLRGGGKGWALGFIFIFIFIFISGGGSSYIMDVIGVTSSGTPQRKPGRCKAAGNVVLKQPELLRLK